MYLYFRAVLLRGSQIRGLFLQTHHIKMIVLTIVKCGEKPDWAVWMDNSENRWNSGVYYRKVEAWTNARRPQYRSGVFEGQTYGGKEKRKKQKP